VFRNPITARLFDAANPMTSFANEKTLRHFPVIFWN
jgi:hypothetical protein